MARKTGTTAADLDPPVRTDQDRSPGRWPSVTRPGSAHAAISRTTPEYTQTRPSAARADAGVSRLRTGGAGGLTPQCEDGGTGEAQDLTAAEIDGKSHGQHSDSVSTSGGRKATCRSPYGGLCVTSV